MSIIPAHHIFSCHPNSRPHPPLGHKHDQRNIRVAFAEFSVGNLLVVDGDVAGGSFEVRHDSSFR